MSKIQDLKNSISINIGKEKYGFAYGALVKLSLLEPVSPFVLVSAATLRSKAGSFSKLNSIISSAINGIEDPNMLETMITQVSNHIGSNREVENLINRLSNKAAELKETKLLLKKANQIANRNNASKPNFIVALLLLNYKRKTRVKQFKENSGNYDKLIRVLDKNFFERIVRNRIRKPNQTAQTEGGEIENLYYRNSNTKVVKLVKSKIGDGTATADDVVFGVKAASLLGRSDVTVSFYYALLQLDTQKAQKINYLIEPSFIKKNYGKKKGIQGRASTIWQSVNLEIPVDSVASRISGKSVKPKNDRE